MFEHEGRWQVKPGPVVAIGAIAAALLYAVSSKASPSSGARQLYAGRAYQATFELPFGIKGQASQADLEKFKSIMPPGASLSAEGYVLTVKFIAPTTAMLTDVTTPVGVLKLTSLQELG
jgi:hypothetical protein